MFIMNVYHNFFGQDENQAKLLFEICIYYMTDFEGIFISVIYCYALFIIIIGIDVIIITIIIIYF